MRFVHVSSVLAPLGASLVALAIAGCGDKAPKERLAPPGPPPTPTLEQVKSATVNGVFDQAITLAGARVVFADIAPGTWHLDPQRVAEAVTPRFRTNSVESSTVDPTKAMVAMIEVSRAYEMNANLVGLADNTLGRAVNDIGRVR